MVKRYTVADIIYDFAHTRGWSDSDEVVMATDYDALKEQRDFAVRELEAILFMLQREKGKEEK